MECRNSSALRGGCRQLQCVSVHRALQSSCALACFVHQLLQNVTHFPLGAAATGSGSGPSTGRSSVIIAARQRANLILYSLSSCLTPPAITAQKAASL